MKRRYANFHRARKYHRKFRNALFSGWIDGTAKYSDLHDKYEAAAILDGTEIEYVGTGDRAYLVPSNRVFEHL